jgi:hypothetical protein
MTLRLNCKDAGDQYVLIRCKEKLRQSSLTMQRNMGIEVHGYTEETWNEEMAKNKGNFQKLIRST